MSKKQKNKNKFIRNRFLFLSLILITSLGLLLSRSFYLQYIEKDYLNTEGEKRHIKLERIASNRGNIYDRRSTLLAVSTPIYNVVVDPKKFIESKIYSQQIQILSEILSMNVKGIDSAIKKRPNRRHLIIKKEITDNQIEQIRSNKWRNYLYLEKSYKRFNPSGEVTGQFLGFTDLNDRGQEGLEYMLNDYLVGTDGIKKVLKDRKQNVVRDLEFLQAAKDGNDIYTSIDLRIQFIAHRALSNGLKNSKAKAASAIVLDIRTGEILAMVNQPSADPNDRSSRQAKYFKNRVVTDQFEPGSTFKPLIVATGIENKIFSSQDTIDTTPFYIGKKLIGEDNRCSSQKVTPEKILVNSCNAGTARMSLQTESKLFSQMLNNLGIGRVTASGFPGEASGTLDGKYDRWRDIRRASLSYGYGVDVTLLQLASIYSVLANKGIKNHVSIERIEGEPVSERVLSEETAKELLLMLEQVVENGVRRAKVNGYRIGGKTGTVQIYSSGYSNKSHNGIFVGIAPISEPRIVTAVIVNEPGGDQFYGGQVAAPIFSSIASASLRILGIAPDKVNN